ncbi:hypothetical protein FRB95_014290 [Tulasnella sp. JGI-2019a]|nr:hypothetical protein FRB95_014290 [Tulasnella sp. JGI-2019a]
MESNIVSENAGQAMITLQQTAAEAATPRYSSQAFASNSSSGSDVTIPIGQLPDELLIKIFQHTLKSVKYRYYESLFELTFVCLRWVAVVRNTPSLWSFTEASDPLRINSMVVERSSKYPLEVLYEENRWGMKLIPEAKSRAWIDMVGEQIYRWQKVKLIIRNDSSRKYLLDYLEKLSAPILETLEIDGCVQWGSERTLFGGGAQQLRNISLSGIHLTWDSILLSGLSNLQTLKIDQNVPSPSVPQIR